MVMNYSIEYQEDIVLFTLKTKSLDSVISAELKAKILIICQPDIKALIVDLSNVEYIDSSGFGALLLAHRQLRDHGIPIYMAGVNDMVKTMFGMLQITDLFTFNDTLENALKEAKQNP